MLVLDKESREVQLARTSSIRERTVELSERRRNVEEEDANAAMASEPPGREEFVGLPY